MQGRTFLKNWCLVPSTKEQRNGFGGFGQGAMGMTCCGSSLAGPVPSGRSRNLAQGGED